LTSHINLFKHDVNYVLTFQEYNKELRPFRVLANVISTSKTVVLDTSVF